jgi:hypothetical protein
MGHMTTHYLLSLFNILITNDNTYTTNERIKMYFVDFFVHPKFIVVYNLFNVTNEILVINIGYN